MDHFVLCKNVHESTRLWKRDIVFESKWILSVVFAAAFLDFFSLKKHKQYSMHETDFSANCNKYNQLKRPALTWNLTATIENGWKSRQPRHKNALLDYNTFTFKTTSEVKRKHHHPAIWSRNTAELDREGKKDVTPKKIERHREESFYTFSFAMPKLPPLKNKKNFFSSSSQLVDMTDFHLGVYTTLYFVAVPVYSLKNENCCVHFLNGCSMHWFFMVLCIFYLKCEVNYGDGGNKVGAWVGFFSLGRRVKTCSEQKVEMTRKNEKKKLNGHTHTPTHSKMEMNSEDNIGAALAKYFKWER